MKFKGIALILLFFSVLVHAEEQQLPIHHLVVVWLKPDQTDAFERYQDASKVLQALPGVLQYKITRRASIARARPNPSVDDSFDLIVDSRFASAEALEAFLKHPDYVQIAQQHLRPLVDRYRIYDFVE